MAPGGSGGSSTGMAGEDVLSTFKGSAYEELAGTSQAAPHVAGVAALLVSLGVRGQAAVERLRATATDLGAPGDDAAVRRRARQRARGAWRGWAAARRAAGRRAARSPALGPFVRIKRRHGARAVRRRGIRMRVRAIADGPRDRARDVARAAGGARVAASCGRGARRRSSRG